MAEVNVRGARLVVMLLASGWALLPASPAAAAATCAAVPPNAFQTLAARKPVFGKAVGSGYDVVALGTITKISHARPHYRYRYTMAVDSVVGAALPGTYTFFGPSRSAYPFAVGQTYAVPLARKKGSGPAATEELWSTRCDPVTGVSDIAAARAIIAPAKPVAKSPAAVPSPATTATTAAAAAKVEALAPRPQITFEDDSTTYGRATVLVTLLMLLGILVAVAAAIESRLMHRQLL
jgi:hypothetical protein